MRAPPTATCQATMSKKRVRTDDRATERPMLVKLCRRPRGPDGTEEMGVVALTRDQLSGHLATLRGWIEACSAGEKRIAADGDAFEFVNYQLEDETWLHPSEPDKLLTWLYDHTGVFLECDYGEGELCGLETVIPRAKADGFNPEWARLLLGVSYLADIDDFSMLDVTHDIVVGFYCG